MPRARSLTIHPPMVVANGARGRNILLLHVVGEWPRIGRRHEPNMTHPSQLQLSVLLAHNSCWARILRSSTGCSQNKMFSGACGNLAQLFVCKKVRYNSYMQWCEDLADILRDYICSSKPTPACVARPFDRKQVLLPENHATTKQMYLPNWLERRHIFDQ